MNRIIPLFVVQRGVMFSALVVTLAAPPETLAAFGDLDPTFGGIGHVRTGFGEGDDFGNAMTIQADGKVVVAGRSSDGPEATDFSLVRYLSDGTLDSTFGTNGKVMTDFGAQHEEGKAVVQQSDGKLVVAGNDTALGTLTVARYLSNGSLDASFGVGGLFSFATPPNLYVVNAIALQADGRIVLAGSHGANFMVARLLSNGTLDTSFSGDGIATTLVGNASAARAMVIQSDGRILTAGWGVNFSVPGFALVRYNTNGTLDTGFDGDGMVLTWSLSIGYSANALALQTSPVDPTKILVAGSAWGPTGLDVAMARYDTNGALDTAFSGDGIAIQSVSSGDDVANSIRIDYSGGNPSRIFVAGQGRPTNSGSHFDMFVGRFFLAGGIDAAFDGDGIVVAPFGASDDFGNAFALPGTGKIYLAGTTGEVQSNSHTEIATVRWNSNGSLDTSWDGDGVRRDDVGHGLSNAEAVRALSDGRILVAGERWGLNIRGIVLARYNADGTLDSTFDGDGRVTLDIGTFDSCSAHDVAIQADGKYLTAGEAYLSPTTSRDFAVVRHLPSGALDTSFSGDGIATVDFSPVSDVTMDWAQAVAVHSDQTIVVAGTTLSESAPPQVAVARFLPNGTLDTSFNGTGKWTSSGILVEGEGNAVAIAGNGKIYVAGHGQHPSVGDAFLLLRLLTNGTLDPAFSDDGIANVALPPYSLANAITLQSDGRPVLAGRSDSGLALMRFNFDGTLDESFNGFGVQVVPFQNVEWAESVAILPGGKILASGIDVLSPVMSNCVFACLNPDGTLDSSFGVGGKIVHDLFPDGEDKAQAVTVDAGGNPVFTGYSQGLFSVGRLESGSVGTGVDEIAVTPGGITLGSPFPNPMRDLTTVRFESRSDAPVDAAVIDVTGRRIRALDLERPDVGAESGTIRWDGTGSGGQRVAAGVYFLRVQQGEHSEHRPVTILR